MKTAPLILRLARCFPNSELTRRELIKIKVINFPACLNKIRKKCLYDASEMLLENHVKY